MGTSSSPLRILVTGGAGFIGSNFVEMAVQRGHKVLVLDALTYAGHKENLEGIPGVELIEGSITDADLVRKLIVGSDLNAVLNFAAESHVDRSISGPSPFIETNLVGTFQLLEASLAYWKSIPDSDPRKKSFRYLQVSTDEVFGQLGETGKFHEETPYQPNSPYSASKAGADHLVRAWNHTFGLPTVITNCSNNYGPRQTPEKLIPLMVTFALQEKKLPVYGDGSNIRDWIFVEDHCEGIFLALEKGKPGSTFCFGGNAERRNLDLVKAICKILDEIRPRSKGKYEELITFVTDRPGHDWRYAIDDSLAKKELGFDQSLQFEEGLRKTIEWYLANTAWSDNVSQKLKGSQ